MRLSHQRLRYALIRFPSAATYDCHGSLQAVAVPGNPWSATTYDTFGQVKGALPTGQAPLATTYDGILPCRDRR